MRDGEKKVVVFPETVEEWNALGRYTIHLGGLHTPVVLDMDGTSVLSISAFDQRLNTLRMTGIRAPFINIVEVEVIIACRGLLLYDKSLLVEETDSC